MNTEALNEVLNIEGDLISGNSSVVIPSTPVNNMIEQTDEETDYNFSRENLYNIINKGTGALDELLNVASTSQHPRAFEVLQMTIKTLVDANMELLKLQKAKKDLNVSIVPPPTVGNVNVNQGFFIGTTKELQELIHKNE